MAYLVNAKSSHEVVIEFYTSIGDLFNYFMKREQKRPLDDTTRFFLKATSRLFDQLGAMEHFDINVLPATVIVQLYLYIEQYQSYLLKIDEDWMRYVNRRYLKPLKQHLYNIQRDFICNTLRIEFNTHLTRSLTEDIERIADTGKDDSIVLLMLKQLSYCHITYADQWKNAMHGWLERAVNPENTWSTQYVESDSEDDEFSVFDCTDNIKFIDEPPYTIFSKNKINRELLNVRLNINLSSSSKKLAEELNSHRGLFESGETHTWMNAQMALAADYIDTHQFMFGDKFCKIYHDLESGSNKLDLAKAIIQLLNLTKANFTHSDFINMLHDEFHPFTYALKKKRSILRFFDCSNSVWNKIEKFVLNDIGIEPKQMTRI